MVKNSDKSGIINRPVGKQESMRIPGLDIIRGFAIVNMILYHLLYNIVYVFGKNVSWFVISQASTAHNQLVYVWQQLICCTFIVVSGISFKLSKNPLKNGIKLFVCAFILNLVTYVVVPEHFIVFGIIHFFTASVLLTYLTRPLLEHLPAQFGLIIAIFLFILFRNLSSGYIGFFSIWQYRLPSSLYQSPYTFFLGLPNSGFRSADYFPIFPWWFLYLAGYYFSAVYQQIASALVKKAPKVLLIPTGALSFMGRNSLIIYMIHQPILCGILLLVYFFN